MFEVRNTGSVSNADRPQIDWSAMNSEIVSVAALQQPETLIGVIAGLYDVGVQPQPDAQYPSDLTAAEEAEEISKDPTVRFEDLKDYQDGGKVKRYKLKPVKPAQSVVLAIDFPDVIVDKGKYFGNSDPKPLRLLLGGEFTPSGGKTIAARPLALTLRKNDKTNNQWSFPFNHTLYKMAVAAKLINQGEPFVPNDIDKLVGKALQFKAQVFLNDGKYYTEKCAFAASLSRGQVVPEYDYSLTHMIQFNADNSDEYLKQLRASVKNTMRNASDFETSKIKDQIGEAFVKGDAPKETQAKVEEKVKTPVKTSTKVKAETVTEADPFNPFDDDVPY